MKFDKSKFIHKFVDEAADRLSNMETRLTQLTNAVDVDMDAVREVKRDMHTLKGSARMLGLSRINGATHLAEDILEAVTQGQCDMGQGLLETMLGAVDRLRDAMAAVSQDGSDENVQLADLEGQLRRCLERPGEANAESQPVSLKFDKNELLRRFGKEPGQSAAKPKPQLSAKPDREEFGPLSPQEDPKREPESSKPQGQVASPRVNEPHGRTMRVNAELLDRMTNLATEAVTRFRGLDCLNDRLKSVPRYVQEFADRCDDPNLREGLIRLKHDLSQLVRDHRNYRDDYSHLLRELHEATYESKLIPLSQAFASYPRLVRDLSAELGKRAHLQVDGEQHQIDKTVLPILDEVLLHMIRNAVDHGIEMPDKREAVGKPPQGKIQLSVQADGGFLIIKLEDDGAGIDVETIRRKAVETGRIGENEAREMGDERCLDLIFASGFSTARMCTDISGRGVGMDVVRKRIAQIHGAVKVQSRVGKGAHFLLKLPVSMSSSRVLFVELGGYVLGLPMDMLDHMACIDASGIKTMEDRRYFLKDDRPFEIVDLGAVLGIKEMAPEDEALLIVLRIPHHPCGVLVERVLFERDVVIRGLGDFLGKISGINGVATLEDGRIVAIVAIWDVFEQRHQAAKPPGQGASPEERDYHILLVDDSLMTRELEASILETAGFRVTCAVDGLDGIRQLGQHPDVDLVISDVEMPNMDGFRLTETIRASPTTRHLPIIIITTRSHPRDRMRGMEAGANAYLEKQSFDRSSLIETIYQLLGV